MKTKKKRFLSILLSLTLMLGLMSGMSLTAYGANSYTDGQTATFSDIAVGDIFEAGAVISQKGGQSWRIIIYIDDLPAAETYTTYTCGEKLTVSSKSGQYLYLETEGPYDLTDATVTVNPEKESTSVMLGTKVIASSKYEVKYGATAENATAEFPTESGSYYAFVTANDTDPRFTGGTKSAAFTVTAASTDTQTSLSSKEGVTVTLSNIDVGSDRIKSRGGSITFTSTVEKIKKIEISFTGSSIVDEPTSGWNPTGRISSPLVWTGTAADSVTLSANKLDIKGFSQNYVFV